MLKVSDTGNHNESSPIPDSAETVIPKPSKPCVTLQAKCERCVYLLQILKVVIKSYIWKMTKQCGGYMYTCAVYNTLKI